MDDRELLEFAAKAAGIEYGDEPGICVQWEIGMKILFPEGGLMPLGIYTVAGFDQGGPKMSCWSPLYDDGDALRLAVRLNMHICIDTYCERDTIEAMYFTGPKLNCNIVSEINFPDPMAATRRAIVRAAAAIGMNMEVAGG